MKKQLICHLKNNFQAHVSSSHQLRSKPVKDGTEGQPATPRRGQVGDADTTVSLGNAMTPFQELIGRTLTFC